jgi:4-aminobutyrate aminotransferase-like enzyme
MTTTESTSELALRAREITARELDVYRQRTVGSQKATERARKVLPLGVPSSFQAYDPHPIVVAKSAGSWMEDVDGNRYIDYDMGFGALFAGHMHPIVPPANPTPKSPSCCLPATASTCGASPTPAPKPRWMRSASPVA